MSARDKLLLRVVVPIAVVAAIWMLLLSPKLDDMKTAGSDVTKARSDVAAAQAELVERQANARSLRAQRATLEAAVRAVPTSIAIPPLLRQLERLAGRTKVDLDAVQQGATGSATPASTASAAGGVNATPITLTFVARYHRTRAFITGLDRLVRVSGQRIKSTGRLVSVSSVTVAPTGSRLNVNIETTVYTLKSDAELSAAAAATAAAAGQTASSGA